MTHTTQDLSAERGDRWIEDAELLPCPFCGGTETTRITNAGGNGSYTVRCCYISPGKGCGADSGYYAFKPEEAKAIWNRRSTRPDQSLIASLTEALEPFARVAEVKPMKHRQQGDILHVTETTLGKAPIRFSDCDRAAAALASAKGAM